MQTFDLQYGTTHQTISLPEGLRADVFAPQDAPPAPEPLARVRQALREPTGPADLAPFAGARAVVIAINDKTRPVPHEHLLPPLLDHLNSLGIPDAAITFAIATGTHIPMPAAEFDRVLPPELLARCAVYSHDCDAADLLDLGATSRGTPIRVNRRFMAADLRIVVGNIEPHHFMGYSGGVKTASIGMTGRATINQNHSWISDANARTAHYEDNPMRQDVEEIGQRIGVHFAVNAVLNNHKEIVEVFAGNPAAVMQAGIPVVKRLCQVRVPHPYDLVIASAGGYPKDINFYQAQKALTHAAMFTRDGGTIILLAACAEGLGSAGFARIMSGAQTFEEVYAKFRQQGFEVGPHKALLVGRDAQRVRIIVVSDMSAETVRGILLTPAESPAAALALALGGLPEPAASLRAVVLPIATITVPEII
jgi:nickel-dependent lactate racemase